MEIPIRHEILLKYDRMHHLSLYFDSKVYRLIFQTTAQIPEVKYGHMIFAPYLP